jgi:GAF domain-containing protein
MTNKFEKNYLTDTMLKLSNARDVPTIIEIVRHAARILTGADGADFILKDNDKCFYVDEDAISPLWKGERLPIEACISGWVMINKESVLIKDIFDDPRIPLATYSTTFVKSLVMVPINVDHPIGAIGNYWGHFYEATEAEISILELLADCTAVALKNVETLNYLEKSLHDSKVMCNINDEYIEILTRELRPAEGLVEDNLQELRECIKQKMVFMSASQAQEELKRSIYDVSLKQLSEMNKLFKEFLVKDEKFIT